MLFMVIERFGDGGARAVGERFRARGRMLPEGVSYLGSWVDESGAQCFQLMEAASRGALEQWTREWDDLVEFEIVAVRTSKEFWASQF